MSFIWKRKGKKNSPMKVKGAENTEIRQEPSRVTEAVAGPSGGGSRTGGNLVIRNETVAAPDAPARAASGSKTVTWYTNLVTTEPVRYNTSVSAGLSREERERALANRPLPSVPVNVPGILKKERIPEPEPFEIEEESAQEHDYYNVEDYSGMALPDFRQLTDAEYLAARRETEFNLLREIQVELTERMEALNLTEATTRPVVTSSVAVGREKLKLDIPVVARPAFPEPEYEEPAVLKNDDSPDSVATNSSQIEAEAVPRSPNVLNNWFGAISFFFLGKNCRVNSQSYLSFEVGSHICINMVR